MGSEGRFRSKVALFTLLGHENEAIAASFGTDGFSRHYHDTFSFGLVHSGLNQFGYRRRTFEAAAGTVGICDPGEVHDGGMAGIPWSYRSAFPSAEAMTTVASEVGMDGLPAFNTGHIADPLSVRRLHRFLTLLFDSGDGATADEIEEAGVDAFATIIARNAVGVRRQHGADLSSGIAAKALEMIHDRWHEPVRLAEMADAAGASRFSTIRSVSRTIGLTPHAYLLQLRVHKAKALMRSGVSIAGAAADAGFVDQAHLSRVLNRRWGVTPGAFSRAYARARRTQ